MLKKDNKEKIDSENKNIVSNEEKQNNGCKQNKGITLVALVITIIIIIILATITMNMAFGDNGLIKQAQKAKDMAANSVIAEQEGMNSLMGEFANVMAEDSEITPPDPGPTLPEGWDGDKVTAEESSDGVTVPVPKGYTASDATGERSVNDGFVIYEGTEEVNDGNVDTAKTTRNQFVWIPVPDISQIANQTSGTDGNNRQNYQGKLYDFSSSRAKEKTSYGQGTTSYREPDVVTGSDGTSYDNDQQYVKTILGLANSDALKTQLQEEFNEMIASVDTYGGFYIGRYETGNLASNTSTEPVVVKGNEDISDVNWYYMYQNSKKVAANNNVVSTMIWGSMWDRALIWLTETGEKTYEEITNSATWGNYSDSTGAAATNSGSRQPTGTNEAWKANNIYDLAGNVYDWTIEATNTNGRVNRGGYSSFPGSNFPSSSRSVSGPAGALSDYGARLAFYVAL